MDVRHIQIKLLAIKDTRDDTQLVSLNEFTANLEQILTMFVLGAYMLSAYIQVNPNNFLFIF